MTPDLIALALALLLAAFYGGKAWKARRAERRRRKIWTRRLRQAMYQLGPPDWRSGIPRAYRLPRLEAPAGQERIDPDYEETA